MTSRAKSGRVLLAIVVVAAALVGGLAGGTGSAAAQEECSFPVTETDATGTEVTVEDEPGRVVTLSPSATQTMWEIGARDKVVGLTHFSYYLEGAEDRANVSSSGQSFVSVERVVAQNPDLVLAPNVIPEETVSQLRDAGLTVYKFEAAESIEDIQDKTLLTGELVGECEGAGETVDWMDEELQIVEEAVEGQDRPRVLYVFFGFTTGNGTFQHDVITTAGATNVAAAANITGFQMISEEVVADQDPEYIVLNDGSPAVPESEAYNGTTAVQEDNIVVVNESHISQPAPRVVLVVRELAQALHPEAYEEAASTPTPTPTATATPEETETPTPAESPGLGIVVGLVALLSAAALVGRR